MSFCRAALGDLRTGQAIGDRVDGPLGEQGRAEAPLGIHLEIADQARDLGVGREDRQGRALQVTGLGVALHDQEGVVGKAPGRLGVEQIGQAGVQALGQLLRQDLLLVEALPFESTECLVDEDSAGQGERHEEGHQPEAQASPVESAPVRSAQRAGHQAVRSR